MPVRINSNWRLASLPTSSVIRSRSRATICEVLATESLCRPVAFAGSSTLPGASAHTRLLVNGTQTTVRIRLRFNASPWTTIMGLRNPGPEPVGFGKSAQYTWPWAITIQCFQAYVWLRQQWQDQVEYRWLHKLDSWPRSRLRDHGARRILSPLPYKPGCATSLSDGIAAQRRGKSCRESRSQFSYPKYNCVPGPRKRPGRRWTGQSRREGASVKWLDDKESM